MLPAGAPPPVPSGEPPRGRFRRSFEGVPGVSIPNEVLRAELQVTTAKARYRRPYSSRDVTARQDEERRTRGGIAERNEYEPLVQLIARRGRQLGTEEEPAALLGFDLNGEQPVGSVRALCEQINTRGTRQRQRDFPAAMGKLGSGVEYAGMTCYCTCHDRAVRVGARGKAP